MTIQIQKENLRNLLKFHPHQGQKKINQSKARFITIVAGRRWGKTKYVTCEGIIPCLILPNMNIWVVAPTYDLTERVWELLYGYAIKELRPVVQSINNSKGSYKIRTKFNSVVEAKSADDPQTLVGKGLDLLVIDEAGLVKEQAWKEALRPALMDKQGSAIFIGTPKGKNWFYQLYLRGRDSADNSYESFRFPSYENPYLPKSELQEIIKDMPELEYRQEILAEFLEDGGAVFRNIENCIGGFLEEPNREEGYIFGIDIAKHQDFSVIIGIKKSTRQVIFFDRFNQIDWGFQKARFVSAIKRYNNATLWIDATGIGDPIFDDLVKEGLRINAYKYTQEAKLNLIQHLAIVLEEERIKFPKIEQLINELKSFEYETLLPSGRFRYCAPEGLHDDCVNALALAVWGLDKSVGFSFFRSDSPKVYTAEDFKKYVIQPDKNQTVFEPTKPTGMMPEKIERIPDEERKKLERELDLKTHYDQVEDARRITGDGERPEPIKPSWFMV